MPEATDFILPFLREMRAEITARFDSVDARFDMMDRRLKTIDAQQTSYKQALTADTLLSRLLTGEFEERIESLERRLGTLESRS